MATENIKVTLGVDYFIEVNIDRFTELLQPQYTLTGQARVLSTNALVSTFTIIKGVNKNKIYLILKSADTKTLVINNQYRYIYDIIAKNTNTNEIYKLIDGTITFKPSITTI